MDGRAEDSGTTGILLTVHSPIYTSAWGLALYISATQRTGAWRLRPLLAQAGGSYPLNRWGQGKPSQALVGWQWTMAVGQCLLRAWARDEHGPKTSWDPWEMLRPQDRG